MSDLLFKVQGGEMLLVHELNDDDLDWYANECKAAAKRDAALAELARRRGGGAVAPAASAAPAQTQSIVQRTEAAKAIVGSFDAPRANAALVQAAQHFHLVTPSSVVGSLPEGCEVSISLVTIEKGKETYDLPGDMQGLSRVALDKVFAAAGGTWIRSRRIDDGKDPHYCAWEAVGLVRTFDGQMRELPGNVEIDARDGSPQIAEIIEKAKAGRRDPGKQIMELRKFLLRHAESKAMNRAVAKLGIRRGYKADEIAKPFAVARVIFTGRSEDPEARKVFHEKIADSFLGGQRALYGEQTSPALPEHTGHVTPPVGGVPADDSAIPTDGESDDIPPPRPAAPTATTTAPAAAADGKY